MKVIALAEKPQDLKDLCARAGSIADTVEGVLVGGTAEEAADVATASRVWMTEQGAAPRDCVLAIKALVDAEKPDMVIVQPTVELKLVAGKLAARMNTSAISNLTAIDGANFACMVYGGAGVITRTAEVHPAIVFDAPGVLEPSGKSYSPSVEPLPAEEKDSRITTKGVKTKESNTIDLTKSKRVIGIGRGIQNREDLDTVNELAALMDAGVGCTRPISEGEKWLPRELYIGVSGVSVAPDVYLALGIAGQVQHTIGVGHSKVIFAVNKNADAPIFDIADYGIVADLYKVMPALVDALK